MRAKPFTFTKTKTIKQKTQHDAISVDLTVKEAADLAAYLSPAMTPDYRYYDLFMALNAFALEHGEVSDLVAKGSFMMVPSATRSGHK